MKKKIITIFILLFTPIAVLADAFVPEFDTMKSLRCDFEETIYNQTGNPITKSKQFRLYRLDDTYNKIYLGKEPIDNITYYGNDRIEFNIQSMTDDFIVMSQTTINRTNGEYNSYSELEYDNEIFGTRTAKAVGVCKFLN
ncbi:hypothetical protein IJ541_11310 [bacterium]|nr:hypothetical protein [bacterium]